MHGKYGMKDVEGREGRGKRRYSLKILFKSLRIVICDIVATVIDIDFTFLTVRAHRTRKKKAKRGKDALSSYIYAVLYYRMQSA